MGRLLSDDELIHYGLIASENELYHHGILGMKWGIRRYQNKDGTLTAAGKKRYQKDFYKSIATGIYANDIDYNKLRNSKVVKDRAVEESKDNSFKSQVNNAKKSD